MPQRNITIQNKLGIHVSPASLFVIESGKFRSKITVLKDNFEADGKSIMSILVLGAGHGSIITVKAEGEDAEQALDAIEDLVVRRKFDEV
jgi:phosphocarrier protein HPr